MDGNGESSHGERGVKGHGGAKLDRGPTAWEPLYSAISGLEKRSIKCAVPRICQLKVSNIQALSPLTSKSESNVRLVVEVSDGRSRFRESARSMKVRRAALSSQPLQITSAETIVLPMHSVFYIQYFHNMRKNDATVRILLQKGKNNRLINKTIADCTLNMADVLQCPVDEGQVILHCTGKLKRRSQKGVNQPLVRLNCSLASLPMDMADVDKWWPEDAGLNIEGAVVETLGLLSNSEEEENVSDAEERLSDEEEWVERTEAVIDSPERIASRGYVSIAPNACIDSPERVADMPPEDINGVELERVKLGQKFRSKVLQGTRKFVTMTQTPVHAIRNGYARIKARRGKADELLSTDGVDEAIIDETVLDFALAGSDAGDSSDAEFDGNAARESEEWVRDGGSLGLDSVHAAIASKVMGVLASQEAARQPATVLLLNDTTRRGGKLRDWMELRRAEYSTSRHEAGTEFLLHKLCVCASTGSRVRAALRLIVQDHYEKAERGRRAPTRLALLGNDAYVNLAVREYLALRSMNQKQWDVEPPVRFFIVPVGKRCRDLGLAQRLAQGDAKYASLLMGEAWGSCFDKNEGEECVWDEQTGAMVEEGIMEYLRGAHDTLQLEIAEAFVTCTLKNNSSSIGNNITHQQSLPFISSLSLRALDPDEGSTSSAGGMSLSIDFWAAVAGREFLKTSSRGGHSEVSVRLCSEKEGAGDKAGAVNTGMVLHMATHKALTIASKRVRHAVSLTNIPATGGSWVRGSINKLICTTKDSKSQHFTALADGVKLSPVRFVSVSPSLSSSLVKTFPIAVFLNRKETEA